MGLPRPFFCGRGRGDAAHPRGQCPAKTLRPKHGGESETGATSSRWRRSAISTDEDLLALDEALAKLAAEDEKPPKS